MMKETFRAPLLPFNTFGIEATAHCLMEYDTPDDLRAALTHTRTAHAGLPLFHVGRGSNVVFLGDFEGVVLHSRIRGIQAAPAAAGRVLLRVGAGEVWDDVVDYCVRHGYYGVENLSLIPGETGAAAVQNIGAYVAEVKDVITHVECMEVSTGRMCRFAREELDYGYRQSRFKAEWKGRYVVTHVEMELDTAFRPNLEYGGIRAALEAAGICPASVTPAELRTAIIKIRQSKLPDPAVQGNAGSFFMNPAVPRADYEAIAARYDAVPHYDLPDGRVKIPAAWLIEQSGWKARSLGPVGMHHAQPLVMVNLGGATGADVVALTRAVTDDVHRRFGIELHCEVNFIGNDGV